MNPLGCDAPSPAALTFAAGRYRVERVLGEGSRKRVFLAYDTRLGRRVALAVLRRPDGGASPSSQISREAAAIGRLADHPHVVTVYDVLEEDGQSVVVSQYMSGGDLAERIHAMGGRPLALDEALAVIEQVCDGLAHAHAAGVVHRDVKPANIWLAHDGTAKIGDFGLARVAEAEPAYTTAGQPVGTALYLPPEQLTTACVDARGDLYALGCTLYELLTGQPPFVAESVEAVIAQHATSVPAPPSAKNPDVPPELEALVLRLLAKDPGDRPATALLVRDAMRALRGARSLARRPARHTPARSTGFVGREAEMRRLLAHLEDAGSGRGSTVLLTGEPGIGKSRVADELAQLARARGTAVHWGRCEPIEAAPAYWPFVQVLRGLVASLGAELHRFLPRADAPQIARLVDELRDALAQPDSELPRPDAEPEEARFRLFDAVTRFLCAVAAEHPLLLVVEDLHCADRASLRLFGFLASQLDRTPLLLLATFRDAEAARLPALAESVARVIGTPRHERIPLGGVGPGDIATLIELVASIPAPARLAEALHRRTDGNPLFVNELLRLLVSRYGAEGLASLVPDRVPIPQSVRDVIRHRLDALPGACARILEIASVIGREFEVGMLVELSGGPEEVVLDALDQGASAALVSPVQGVAGGWRFVHAVMQEALYEDLPAASRLRLHVRIGELLERLPEPRSPEVLAGLAWHFLAAAPSDRRAARKAAAHSMRSAEHASQRLGHEQAVEHYARAERALELARDGDATLQLELGLRLGEAAWKAGDLTRARDAFRRVADAAREHDRRETFARAALGYGGLGYSGLWETTGSVDPYYASLLEEALRLLPNQDHALRARAMGRLAMAYYWDRSSERRSALAEQAVAMARRLASDAVLAEAIGARSLALWGPENASQRAAWAEEMVRLAECAGDPALVQRGRIWRITSLLELGAFDEADREIRAFERLATVLRERQYVWRASMLAAMRACLRGDLAAAERHATEAFEVGQAMGDSNALQAFALQFGLVRREQGRTAEIAAAVESMVERFPGVSAWRVARAVVWLDLGREDAAREELRALAAHGFALVPRDYLWVSSIAGVAELATSLRDASAAAWLVDALRPLAGHFVVTGDAVSVYGSVNLIVGQLLHVLGRRDEARALLEDAIAVHDRMQAPIFAGRARLALAELLLEDESQRARALPLLDAALDAARRQGSRMLAERVVRRKLAALGVQGGLSSSIDRVAIAVEERRPDLHAHAARDGYVTLLFTDVEDFTLITERLGDREAHRLMQAHHETIRREIARHAGVEVEVLGDGFVVAFDDEARGLRCAAAIQRAFAAQAPSDAERLRVRMGLHSGPALHDADRFFGKTVIVAARIAALARGDQILVSEELWRRVGATRGGALLDLRGGPPREVGLKGLAGRYGVLEVDWTAGHRAT